MNDYRVYCVMPRIRDYIPQVNVTAFKVAIIEKFVFWESTTEVQTGDLQNTIEQQNKPIIRSRQKEIESAFERGTSYDFLRLKLENYGGGVAQNLYVRPILVINHEPKPGEGTPIDIEDACFLTDSDRFDIDPRFFRFTRREGDFFENDSIQGGVLSPNEGLVEFSTQVEFEEVFYQGDGELFERVPVFEATERLYDAGIRHISLQLYVLYTDVNDNVYAEQVMGATGEISSGVTLKDIQEFDYSSESTSNEKVLQRVDATYKYPP